MTQHPFTYTILQYRHDVWTGEALNLGVFLYCPALRYEKLIARYGRGRIAKAYPDLNASALRNLVQSLQRRVERNSDIDCTLDAHLSAHQIAQRILKNDDSSLQWHAAGSGLTDDPADAHKRLFERYVTIFDLDETRTARSDQQVFETMKPKLEETKLLSRLEARTLTSRFGDVKFDHTFQNGVLHCIQPLSFDSADAEQMHNKAARWVGKMHALASGDYEVKVYFVTGKPQSQGLLREYDRMKDFLLSSPSELSPLVFDEAESNHVVDALVQAARH